MQRFPYIPLHYVLDQEGDTSANYNMGPINILPSPAGLTACGDPKYAWKAGYALAKQLRAAGIHWVHSLVLDVNINYQNPEIQERFFSDDAEVCSVYGREFLKGMIEGKLIATGKHFPGRGDSACDAHHDTAWLDVPRKRLMEVEVKPYMENMDVIPTIMSAHSAFPALDPSGLPATLSKPVLTDFLRGELGFRGVVTTDNMEMQGITKLYPIPEASWHAVAAGADLVLMKSEDAKTCEQTYESILNAVKSGNIPLKRIEEANRRVLSLKIRYGLFDQPQVDASKASEPMRSKEIGITTAHFLLNRLMMKRIRFLKTASEENER